VSLWSLLRTEGRLVWKGRWVALLTLALAAASVWGGPFGTYRYAVRSAERIHALRAAYEAEFAELILDDLVAELQGTLALLHPAMGPNYLLAILAVLGTMVLPIWGAQLVGNEFRHRTAKARAAHVGWGAMVAAKVAWLLLLSAGLATLFAGIGALSGQVTWRAAQDALLLAGEVTPPPLKAPLFAQALTAALGLFFFGLVGLLAALVTRSALAGALVGLALPYVEAFVIGTPEWGWLLPRIAYGNLMVDHFVYLPGGMVGEPLALVPAPAPWVSWAVVAGWTVLACLAALRLGQRQQILS